MRPAFLAALAATLVLATPAQAVATTTYTTNLYDATSTSDDIALSCKELSVVSSTGVLSATCNYEDSSGTVTTNSTTIDLDDVFYCRKVAGRMRRLLTWGSPPANAEPAPESWQAGVSSNGKDYRTDAVCPIPNSSIRPRSGADLGDTSDGLENNAGSLEAR